MDSSPINGTQLTTDYLSLFVTQIQNQNPLEPLEQDAFLTQLAQFSMVSGIEQISERLGTETPANLIGQGAELVGKGVTFEDEFTGEEQFGEVDRVYIETDGLFAEVGGKSVPVGQINSIFQVGN